MTGKGGDRPIPVRELLAGGRTPSRDAETGTEPPEHEPPPPPDPGLESRVVAIDGGRWRVEALGRTRSGHVPDAGALLLTVGFTRVEEEPDDADTGGRKGPPVRREALAVARTLDDLSIDDLEALLGRSRVRDAQESVSR